MDCFGGCEREAGPGRGFEAPALVEKSRFGWGCAYLTLFLTGCWTGGIPLIQGLGAGVGRRVRRVAGWPDSAVGVKDGVLFEFITRILFCRFTTISRSWLSSTLTAVIESAPGH